MMQTSIGCGVVQGIPVGIEGFSMLSVPDRAPVRRSGITVYHSYKNTVGLPFLTVAVPPIRRTGNVKANQSSP